MNEQPGRTTSVQAEREIDMDIQNDVNATAYQVPAFMGGTEMGTLYLAMKERWGKREPFCNAFDASLFYRLGLMHGIRQERARRRRNGAAGQAPGDDSGNRERKARPTAHPFA